MATKTGHNGGAATLEEGIRDVFQRARGGVSEQLHQYEETVRTSPTNSVVIAGLVGYFLHILPIGAFISAILRVLTALLRPAIFLYIAAKMIDVVRTTTSTQESKGKSAAGT